MPESHIVVVSDASSSLSEEASYKNKTRNPLKSHYKTDFSEKSIRHAFIRKVFSLVTIQLAIVLGLIALFMFQKDCKEWVQKYYWVYYISYAVFLITYLAISCCQKVRRTWPYNLICLFCLTLSMGYMLAMISSYHNTWAVFVAMGVTVFCCTGVILFACQTRFDLTRWTMLLFVAFLAVLVIGASAFFIHFIFRINLLFMILAGVISLIFMGFLAIEIQMLMGNKKLAYNPEDYVSAAVEIFCNIVMIFQCILCMIGYGE